MPVVMSAIGNGEQAGGGVGFFIFQGQEEMGFVLMDDDAARLSWTVL